MSSTYPNVSLKKNTLDQRFRVAWLAFGYFATYLLYTIVVKALSLRPIQIQESIPALSLLPGVAIGASCVVCMTILATGQWRATREQFANWQDPPIPWIQLVLSGVATALIVATTTLSYGFVGVTILLALVMMRAGVLVMSPLLDALFNRRIHWYSVLSLLLALCAVLSVSVYSTKGAIDKFVIANLILYLTGYAIRLYVINKNSKTLCFHATSRYFVLEQLFCYPTLIGMLLLAACIGEGEIARTLQKGWTEVFSVDGWGSIVVGVLYGSLFVFGTMIYLDWRENTFCIALNRSASLMSGIVASVLFAVLGLGKLPSRPEMLGAVSVAASFGLLIATVYTGGKGVRVDVLEARNKNEPKNT